eukprot:gnl/MRDRNA2_/MRDRNA2_81491_c0_seq3.p1 gnl/MRDRNA2_/MRDRNA2_81491_c0~~gnl/MRDRNA2_/MRDRNA2_81491_c0_seq3.p1  ORF type:complete len:500 (-),score=114.29 gnl/MRDRNA2_/MRDRNA2_81491_c0_seq3:44-1543(-)
MTTTPESWDDVGCLRLQVNCISQNVEDVQLHVSQLQKLSDQLVLAQEQEKKKERCREQEQKKERCHMKIFIVATAGLFGCLLAMMACVLVLLYTIYAGSAPRLTQSLSDEVWKPYVGDFKASEATTLMGNDVRNGQQLRQNGAVAVLEAAKELLAERDNLDEMLQATKKLLAEHQHLARENTDERTEKTVTMLKHWDEARKATAANPSYSWTVVEEKELGSNQTHEPETRSAHHPRSSADAGGRIQTAANSLDDDPQGVREDAQDTRGNDFNEREGHDDGEQTREEPGNKKSLSPSIDLSAAASVPAEGEKLEAIEATQDKPSAKPKAPTDKAQSPTIKSKSPTSKAKPPTAKAKPKAKHDMRALPPLPFQLLGWAHSEASNEVLKRARHGMVWVCFPANAFEQSVKTYAPVFNEVARSQKWRMYPFVYPDTRQMERYSEHFCDDVKKITFVMEKWSDVSEVFRRVFEPDQVIQASLVEEFLNDVHSGKLPEISAKGDL